MRYATSPISVILTAKGHPPYNISRIGARGRVSFGISIYVPKVSLILPSLIGPQAALPDFAAASSSSKRFMIWRARRGPAS